MDFSLHETFVKIWLRELLKMDPVLLNPRSDLITIHATRTCLGTTYLLAFDQHLRSSKKSSSGIHGMNLITVIIPEIFAPYHIDPSDRSLRAISVLILHW